MSFRATTSADDDAYVDDDAYGDDEGDDHAAGDDGDDDDDGDVDDDAIDSDSASPTGRPLHSADRGLFSALPARAANTRDAFGANFDTFSANGHNRRKVWGPSSSSASWSYVQTHACANLSVHAS